MNVCACTKSSVSICRYENVIYYFISLSLEFHKDPGFCPDYGVHGFNAKIGFENMSQDIGQNVSNFAGLVRKADFGHFFCNILGLRTYFSKPIFALKP